MATNNKLKAYVRFDGTGRVIAGSLILQRFKPKVGNWKEIPANECCNYVPTTTTTTTAAPVTTTTTTTTTPTTTTTTTTSDLAPIVVNEAVNSLANLSVSGNLLTNDSDPTGGTLSITQFTVQSVVWAPGSLVTIPSVGTIIVNANGAYTFTPDTNYTGVVPIIGYTVTSSTSGLSTNGSLSIVVSAPPTTTTTTTIG